MSDNDPNSSQNKRPSPGGGDPQFNWRGIVLFALTFALIAGFFLMRGGSLLQPETIPYNKFVELVQNNQILTTSEYPLKLVVEQGSKTEYFSGFYRKTPAPQPSETGPGSTTAAEPPAVTATAAKGADAPVPFRVDMFMAFNGPEIQRLLAEHNIPVTTQPESNLFAQTVIAILPIALFLLVLYFFFRSQIKMAGKGALNFGKSKAKMMARDKNKITFKDVAGVEEAKDEVQELVEFLKDPKKFQKLGGRIPKGVLMVGSPGTGKTLLARAIAGEADVPFFSISGSDFVEMFVGVGASRVRDMFEQGRKSAPCLIFIDEIDAVGRHRGHGLGGGHDEREQTLNQLLVEMDGFDAQDGVIIIAATNRPDVLDPALLRPGRFDRQVTVQLPDVKGREEILRVHAKKVKMAEDVDLAVIARGTPGFSGAELANVINEAALSAARAGLKAITTRELDEARDKVRWGRERRSLAMSESEKTGTAWHEAGHAILNVLLPHTDPLHKVTIIPRGPSLGVTMWLPEGDQHNLGRKKAISNLAVGMGGRIAEEMFTNDVSTGASGDIMQSTKLARRMVCEWGMSSLGMIRFTDENEHVFLGRDMAHSREYSEATAQQIDNEVKKLIDDAYEHARQVLETHRDKVELIARALLEFETLEGSQVKDLIELGHMRNPPVNTPKPPPLPPTPLGDSTPEPLKPPRPDLPPGGLPAPSPA